LRDPRHGTRLGDIRHQVAMRQHHALGPSGRAAGIGQDDDMILQVHGGLRLQRLAHDILERQVCLRPDDHDVAHARPLGGGARHLDEGRDGDQHHGTGIDQLVMDLGRGIGRVDRGHRPPAPGHPVKDDRILRHVRRKDRDRAARQHAALRQPARQPLDAVRDLARGQGPARGAVDDRHLLLAARQPLEQLLGDRDGGHIHRAVAARVSCHRHVLPTGAPSSRAASVRQAG